MRVHVVGKAVMSQSFFNEKLNKVTTLVYTVTCSEDGTRKATHRFEGYHPFPVVGEFAAEEHKLWDWMYEQQWVTVSDRKARELEAAILKGEKPTINDMLFGDAIDLASFEDSSQEEEDLYDCIAGNRRTDEYGDGYDTEKGYDKWTLTMDIKDALSDIKAMIKEIDLVTWVGILNKRREKENKKEIQFSELFDGGDNKVRTYKLCSILSIQELGEVAYLVELSHSSDCPEMAQVYVENVLTGEVKFTSRKERLDLRRAIREIQESEED